MQVGVTVEGVAGIVGRFANINRQKNDAARRAVAQEILSIFEESQDIVPVRTGALRQSGHINPMDVDGYRIEGTISYTAPYALYVHENLEAYHPHGQAKYLEVPLARHQQRAVVTVAARIADILGGL